MLKRLAIGISGALLCVVAPAYGQYGDSNAGRAFAVENCRQCHAVGKGGRMSSPLKAAPAFRAIANMSTTTPLGLRVFLNTSHPTMPNLILSKKEVDDVISYIMSLRPEPAAAAPNRS